MRTFVLALVVTLAAACSHNAPPPINQAVYHAGTLVKVKPSCIPMPGVPDSPDAALCSVGGKLLLWCWSGSGVGSDCAIVGNYFPKETKEKGSMPYESTAPQPAPPVTAPSSPPAAAPPAPSPAPGAPDKPKADPPKKVETKK